MNPKLIVYDFDGVMTNNQVLVLNNGQEGVFCNRSDGLAVERIFDLKISQIILTSEVNEIVRIRGRKLNVLVIPSKDKKSTLVNFCKANNIFLSDVIFIGNDLNDLEVMSIVGFSVCPADACQEIKEIADIVTSSSGGEGVIREFYSILLEKQWLNKK